ncbi:NAD(P)-binding protein [Corynespora cassiicola Philippines]|uniref:NAD(P)-binding protein n=1 Tax=Corynespora cassiicola Philippines TaxID=1448308 RepID=A0A2T2N1J7_CORCC|nr:NAD(P)-binding protein [Corynespora cassiicola Philippines]
MSPSQFHPDQGIPDLSSKVYIVTGGSSGIGKSTVLHLAQHNAKVYLSARSLEKAQSAISEIRAEAARDDLKISVLVMDMLDLQSVKRAALEFLSKEDILHGIVNNAGIMAVANAISKDGYEYQWQTNYIAHWLFTYLLIPLLESTAAKEAVGTVRVVNVASSSHKMAPPGAIDFEDTNLQRSKNEPWVRYGQSKMGNYLHTLSLHRKLSSKGIWTSSLHPGIVDTNLTGNVSMPGISFLSSKPMTALYRAVGFMIGTDEGSWTQLFAVAGTGFSADMSGGYLEPIAKRGKAYIPPNTPNDVDDRLWAWTENEMRTKGYID